MADAKIVDIKGVQWELKDEVARGKITSLEQKTIVKVTKKIDTETIKMNLVEINDEKFIQLTIKAQQWNGNIGQVIGNFVNDFGLDRVCRCVMGVDYNDQSGRRGVGIDVNMDGTIRVYIYDGNSMTGYVKPGQIFGDAFIRIKI